MTRISKYAVLDHLSEGCEIIDFDLRYLYVNDAAAEQKHKSKDEFLGHTLLELYPGIEATSMFSFLKQCINDRKPAKFEDKFPYLDGTIARFDLKMEPVPEGVFIHSVDISTRKQTELDISPYNKSLGDWSKALEIEGWTEFLGIRIKESEEHILRVTEMTVILARIAGVQESEIVHVRRGALLHDIGKTGIPYDILLKPEKLTDSEWDIIRKHPGYAYDLLYPVEFLRPCLPIPYSHHEKWDGTGYPEGLKGEQIPMLARLFAIVDVWDSLSSELVYHEAWPQDKVMKYIQQQSNKHFDPKVVDLFLYANKSNAVASERHKYPLAG
jgi:HD-GYP domain-containing protein (c-di-GMP phosphodiesterase class II)